MHPKDKQGIQKNVQYSTDQYREHPCVSKALAVDKRVHSQSDHHKQGSQKIDPYVVCRIGKGYITGAKGIEDRSVKDKANGCQDHSCADQHHKGVSHEHFCFFPVSSSPFHGAKRCSSISKKIGKCGDQGDNRKTQSHSCQCSGSDLRNPSDIDPVYNVVKEVQDLCNDHRHSHFHNVTIDISC